MKHFTDMIKFPFFQRPGTRLGISERLRKMTSIALILFGLATVFAFGTAWAIDLGSAKQQGLVGETPSGYLQTVGSQNSEVNDLVSRINAKRKNKYQSIASKNNINLNKVEALAGKKAIEKSAAGDYVLVGGSWKRK